MITLVHQWISAAAKRHPEKHAVCCKDDTLTFRELDERTNALARGIQAAGASRGSIVPFFMKKGVRSIQSVVGILKADCAYVPIDADSPKQRLVSIIEATRASVILVDTESASRLRDLVPPELLPRLLDVDAFSEGDIAPVACENLSIDLAYVLFTSGSTGTPKGVMIPHKAIIDYIDWCVETYGLTGDDVISNHAPLYFDNSTFDLYTAFHTGATLHLVPEELNAVIPRLVAWLRERQITTFFCVPSVLRMLLRSGRVKRGSLPDLRHVIAAGEVLPPDVVDAWMDLIPNAQYTNMYGPTEITVDCSYHVIHERPGPERPIPIGKARTNMELFVRLPDGSLTRQHGSEGELLVRGTSVAYGYLGDPERTESAFIQNPMNEVFHDPLYCTGDLVRIEADGTFHFLGRADHQVKLLGYRIELGEIEAVLSSLDEVEEVVVVFKATEPQEIGALMVSRQGVDPAAVNAAMNAALPSYMVPTTVVDLEGDFPMTPNGKYDRQAIGERVFG